MKIYTEELSHTKEKFSSQFARIQQTIEKIVDGDMNFKERIKTLFREHGITIASVLTAIGMTVSTIILAIKNAFGIRGGSGGGKNRQVMIQTQ